MNVSSHRTTLLHYLLLSPSAQFLCKQDFLLLTEVDSWRALDNLWSHVHRSSYIRLEVVKAEQLGKSNKYL